MRGYWHFFTCFLAVLGFASTGVAQSLLQLPLDADNCAIHQALSPETATSCNPEHLGPARGIVLRIDKAVKSKKPQVPRNLALSEAGISATGLTAPQTAPQSRVQAAAPKPKRKPGEQPASFRGAAEPPGGYFIQFAFDYADLEGKFLAHLDRLSEVLSVASMARTCVKIIGHTDTVGSIDYNQGLSEQRALTVAKYLMERGNLPAQRLALEAAGETRPLPNVPGNDPLNRRVEFATKQANGQC